MRAAQDLARVLHEQKINMVYGGGTVGLMGQVARELVRLSGPDAVHGVIPSALVRHDNNFVSSFNKKDIHKIIQNDVYGGTSVVNDMHERKALMAEIVKSGGPGSGFIALPGGYGTLEELAEVTTWNQLGIHQNGVAVFNVDGYWDGLLSWVTKAVEQGFVKEAASDIIVEGKTAEEVVQRLLSYKKSAGTWDLKWEREEEAPKH